MANLNVDYIGTIDDYLTTIDYKVLYGSKFEWKCFGDNAFSYETYSETGSTRSSDVIFDTETKEVYEVTVSSDKYQYKWINPNYIDAHLEECKERKIDPDLVFQEGDRKWALTDSFLDILDKVYAILNNRKFDTSVAVTFHFNDDKEIKILEEAAIKANKTFDEYFTEVLLLALETDDFKVKTPKEDKSNE